MKYEPVALLLFISYSLCSQSKYSEIKYNQLEELMLSFHHQPNEMRKNQFLDALKAWKGDREQVDAICIVGVRIT